MGRYTDEIRGRVIFTGSGDLVIDDLMDHMPDSFQKEKCPTAEIKLLHSLNSFRPHVIVLVISERSKEILQLCDVLEEHERYHNVPLLAVGSQEACTLLQKNLFQKKYDLFERPFNRDKFMETLGNYVTAGIIDEMKQQEEKAKEREKAKEKDDAEKKQDLTIDSVGGAQRKSILVVDDDVRMLSAIKLYLQDLYDVTVVPNGQLAIKFLSKKHADLVLLDYLMPVEDGTEVLRQIRTNTPEPNVPVLFLTGVNDKELVLRCLDLRPKGYLLKPITRETLLERVTEILLGL